MDVGFVSTIIISLSAILTIASVIPYLIEILRGNTKPRVVTWLTWSVLTAIACVAAFVDGQYPTAILLLFSTLETSAVVVLGWHLGDKKFELLDVMSLIGATVGIILWLIFNSPAIAVIATVTIDLIGGIPTLVHSWRKPHEETWITFLIAAIGAGLTLLVISDWRITAFAYPLYIVGMNMLITFVIIGRGRRLKHDPIK